MSTVTKNLQTLLNMDPLELAKQLTAMEFGLYSNIKPEEWLLRLRATNPVKSGDNIARIVELSNKICYWMIDSVLEQDDAEKRAAVINHFISIANHCRTLQNYSSMAAIISGCNSPHVRRLKETQKHVDEQSLSQFTDCESIINPRNGFAEYRALITTISAPAIPFIGIHLTLLSAANLGADDLKEHELIQSLERFQSVPFNITVIDGIVANLEVALDKFGDTASHEDRLRKVSLEREPEE